MSTLVNQVGNTLEGQTGTGTFAGGTMPTLSSPTVNQVTFNTSPGLILDENGNSMISMTAGTSAVNYISMGNASTTNGPFVAAVGTDTNITLQLSSKGNKGVEVQGVKDASSAVAGYVGEVISSNVPAGSPVSFTSGVTKDVTSISLTAGDWDVFGNFVGHGTGSLTQAFGWVSTSSASIPDGSDQSVLATASANFLGLPVPVLRVNVTTTTNVYLSCNLTGTGSITGYGNIYARRMR